MPDGGARQGIMRRAPSTWAWFVVYVVVPLFPYLLGCGARFLGNLSLSWTTFDVKQLAAFLCVASVFVRQSVLDKDIVPANKDKEDEVAGVAALCLGLAGTFLVLFLFIEFVSALAAQSDNGDLDPQLTLLRCAALLLSLGFLCGLLPIQRSFKLRARIG